MNERLPRAVWILSFVSLSADVASEMLYPIMPVYLRHIGFSVALIGVLEGFAEATAGLSKGYFGALSDKLGARMPFVRLGYFLSALSKPMMAVFVYPAWIFAARAFDRLGKGLRTSPRDALLGYLAPEGRRGEIFGFHRRMDTIGAAIGPVLALCWLFFYPGSYQFLFLIAFAPGIVSVLLTFLVSEKKNRNDVPLQSTGDRSDKLGFIGYWNRAKSEYRTAVGGLLAFALINSSDAFLLLRAKETGMADHAVILIYVYYNLVFAVYSAPLGKLGDRIGPRRGIAIGLFIFAAVYAGMGMGRGVESMIVLFFLYGVYAALTETLSKAWITNITPENERGTALGFYSGLQSVATIVASATAGILWTFVSPWAPFALSAVVALGTAVFFLGTPNVNRADGRPP